MFVIPAKAGIQRLQRDPFKNVIPAFAGMTGWEMLISLQCRRCRW